VGHISRYSITWRAKEIPSEADLHKIIVPDPKTCAAKVVDNLISTQDRRKYRFIATSSGIWEQTKYFHSPERVFEDLVLNPDLIHRLVGICTDFWFAFLKELIPLMDKLDAIYMFDDWGT